MKLHTSFLEADPELGSCNNNHGRALMPHWTKFVMKINEEDILEDMQLASPPGSAPNSTVVRAPACATLARVGGREGLWSWVVPRT